MYTETIFLCCILISFSPDSFSLLYSDFIRFCIYCSMLHSDFIFFWFHFYAAFWVHFLLISFLSCIMILFSPDFITMLHSEFIFSWFHFYAAFWFHFLLISFLSCVLISYLFCIYCSLIHFSPEFEIYSCILISFFYHSVTESGVRTVKQRC